MRENDLISRKDERNSLFGLFSVCGASYTALRVSGRLQ